MSLTIRSTGNGLIASPAKPEAKPSFVGAIVMFASVVIVAAGFVLAATSDYVWGAL